MNGHSAGRIEHLDGLRGIAIILVVLFHAYARWPDLIPFGAAYAEFPPFKYGFLGVQLFFLISGFVILMTIEKTPSFQTFLFRRWIRLFPAMLVASLLVFVTAGYFHERPAGMPVLRDIVPGLTFIEPSWWQRVLGGEQGFLEGAFWSLYVEVKFYIVFGLLFFIAGRTIAIAGISILFLLSVPFVLGLELPFISAKSVQLVTRVLFNLSLPYFGWFAAGAMAYLFIMERRRRWLLGATAFGFASAWAGGGIETSGDRIGAIVIFAFFLAVLSFGRFQSLFANRLFVFLGFVSYPLYLIHENAVVSMIIKLHTVVPWIPVAVLPLLPILAVILVAWIIAAFIEPELRSVIRSAARRWPRRQAGS
jgi:peptidoglycan/LPS O-acetylase OafA/YrhL